MNIRKLKTLALLTCSLLVFTACGSSEEEKNIVKIDKKIFGEFTAETLDGKEVTEDIFSQADLTMVNVWATFCGPCVEEMPYLQELSEEYENFQVVGVLSDVTDASGQPVGTQLDTAKDIAKQTGAEYTHIIPSSEMIDNVLSNIQAVPTTIFLNSEGEQLGTPYTGAKSKEDWQDAIEKMFKLVN